MGFEEQELGQETRMTINKLPEKSVFKKSDGKIYFKLNERFIVEAKQEGGKWLGAGKASEITEKNEEVEVLQLP